MQTLTVTVPVSGTCPGCGQLNNQQVPAQAPRGSTAHAFAQISCGACGATVQVTGSATA